MTYTAGQKIRASDLSRQLDGSTSAQYNAAATQTIGTGTQPLVLFGTANRTSSLVTRATSGAGHKFTCLRAGLWACSTSLRWASATAGERYVLLNSNNGGLGSNSSVIGSNTGPFVANVAGVFLLAANDTVWVEAFQNSGGNRDLEFNNATAWGRIDLAWLHD